MQTATCSKCHRNLPVSDFYRRSDRASGHKSRCKKCDSRATMESRAKRTVVQRDGDNQRHAQWCRGNPGRVMWYRARARARRKDIPFDIEQRDVVTPAVCPVLGIPIACGDVGRGYPTDNSPSLDRIDPSRGYVRGNIVVMSMRANRIKNDATLAELRALVAYLERGVA